MEGSEKLKAEILEALKAEILEELQINSRKRVPGLEIVRKKWFYGLDGKHSHYENSKMDSLFGNDQHRIWEAVRSLTRIIFEKECQIQLRDCNQDEILRVADALCDYIYLLKKMEGKSGIWNSAKCISFYRKDQIRESFEESQEKNQKKESA